MAKGAKSGKRQRDNAKPNSSNSFVVVNPSMLRAAGKSPVEPPKKKNKVEERKPKTQPASDKNTSLKPTTGKGGSYVCDVCNISVTAGAREMHEQGKKHKQRVVQTGVIPLTELQQKNTIKEMKCTKYMQCRDEESLGALYSIIEVERIMKAVVIVPNKASATQTPQTLASVLKQLGYPTLAIHAKTPSTLRAQYLDRLLTTQECILVTTEHILSSLSIPSTIELVAVRCQRACQYALLSMDTTPLPIWTQMVISKVCLQKAVSRAKIALNIHELLLDNAQTVDQDEKWVQKLAHASGLDDDTASTKKAGLTPTQQKLQALSEKLFLVMATSLQDTRPSNLNKMKEKLNAVGLVAQNAATGMSLHNTRLSAQTQWLDAASGELFGGHWDGCVRHGASKDKTSLEVRSQLKSTDPWRPNPQPSDTSEWGGRFGKPCSHNEVVLHNLRPFYPQEVLNARVCCRAKPAPGNDGFDGCLEYLQWQCRERKQAMTLWDAEAWIYIADDGSVDRLSKKSLLHLPLSFLQWLMTNFRRQTIRLQGKIRPRLILEAFLHGFLCGNSKTKQKLPLEVRQLILGYCATGSPEIWRTMHLIEK